MPKGLCPEPPRLGMNTRRTARGWYFFSGVSRQFSQPLLSAIRLDVVELLPVYSRRTSIGFAAQIRKLQHVISMNLVVQRIEPKAGVFLRFHL